MIPGLKADENGDVWDIDGNYVTNINTFTYEFLSNGEFTFEFVDKAGNKGTATAIVDWIDTTAPSAQIEYDIKSLTNKDVTASISFDEENVTVRNNDGKTNYVFTENGEFIFEFQDAAGNTGSITAKVDWIDKVAPTAELKYDIKEDKVIVTVINPSKEITFKEGNGIYEYTKNGNYEIEFYDSIGNVGKLIAKIDSFEEDKDDGNQPENPDVPTNPDGNKPENPDVPTNPDDNQPENPDVPTNPDDNKSENSNKPNNNITSSNNGNSNYNSGNNSNTTTNNNNDTNENNTTTTKTENNKPNNVESKTTTRNSNKENTNLTEKVEKNSKGNKIIPVVIIVVVSLISLFAYIIKKIK